VNDDVFQEDAATTSSFGAQNGLASHGRAARLPIAKKTIVDAPDVEMA
jgi:hypothetical protein